MATLCAEADDLHPEVVRQYGCEINLHDLDHQWHVIAWAKRDGMPDYRHYIAVRPKLEKAAKDCDNWMKSVRKQVKPRPLEEK